MEDKKFPFGTQFTPAQINLDEVLDFIKNNESETTNNLITFLSKKNNNKAMAENCKNALVSYGILKTGGGCYFTEFGKRLCSLINYNEKLDFFAKHILQNLNGMILIDSLRDFNKTGKKITNESFIKYLNERGFSLSQTSNNVQSMKLWLEKADVLRKWNINETKLEKLLDIKYSVIDELKNLNKEQYLFCLTLCANYNGHYLKASEVRNLTSEIYKTDFTEKTFKKQIITPLCKENLIEEKSNMEKHGGTSPYIKPTEKSLSLYKSSIMNQLKNFYDNEFIKFISKSLPELYKDLESDNSYSKGIALEAFAVKIMHMVGLSLVKTRLRGNQTGGAEVDVIFESTELLYSRWQVQCKNTKTVELDQVAKEVGLSHMLKSNAIVIMTTGKITTTAREYSDTIMRDMNICIIHIDGDDLNSIIKNPLEIRNIFNRESLKAKQIKILDLKN